MPPSTTASPEDATIVLSNRSLSLGVAPLGAEMKFLRTSGGADLLWSGDVAFWSGRAPVLFPIVGRAAQDVIVAGGQRAEMAQHGFARRSRFDLLEATESTCTHRLRASAETRAIYPFAFELLVTHALDDATLVVTALVRNLGDVPMPFGFGFHPAFRWPLPGADGVAHVVELAGGGTPLRRPLRPNGLLARDLVAGPFEAGSLAITDALFAEGALVFPGGNDALRYGVAEPRTGPSLTLSSRNLPDLALWRPLGAPFLCIEPWHGTASLVGDGPEIAERPGSLSLAPGALADFGYALSYAP